MEKLISNLIKNGIIEGVFPGAVAHILTRDTTLYHEAFGYRQLTPKRHPLHRTTVFDIASLTKPIVTTTLCMQLVEKHITSLDTPACAYLPHFRHPDITLRHLLTHTSGLPAWHPVYLETNSPDDVISYIGKLPLQAPPGEKTIYSCLGYIVLGELIVHLNGLPLDIVTQECLFTPLNMGNTRFNPPGTWREICAATEDSNSFERRKVGYQRYDWREGVIVGEVHDENAHYLGGVSGNAGLFSTSPDMGKFCRMLMTNGGDILTAKSVRAMQSYYPAQGEQRSIGWIVLEDGSLYHTGFTGTSIRICLKRNLAAILLTNRVHPNADRAGIIAFRKAFHDIIFVN